MNPKVLEKLVIKEFNSLSNGKISLSIKKASLFRGFIIEDINISSGPDFDYQPIFQLDKFTFLYSVYGFFVGDLGVHELGFYKPKVFLYQKNGKWNSDTLMKPGEAEQEEEEPQEVSGEPGPAEINLPLSVRLFFKFVLQDFEATIDGGDGSDPIQAGVKNLTFHTTFITKKIKQIPLDQRLPKIFETFVVNLDPQKEIDFYLKIPDTSINGPMEAHWLMAADGETTPARFSSKMTIGERDLPVTYEGLHLLPLNFSINYAMDYNHEKDRLSLNNFTVKFLNDTWLNLNGVIDKPTRPEATTLQISLDESSIDLKKLMPYYKSFTGDAGLSLSGNLSLAPLTIDGPLNNLNIDGKIRANKIRATAAGSKYYIPTLELYYGSRINLDKADPVLFAKLGWRGKLNEAALKTEVEYNPKTKINALVAVNNFNPALFVEGIADGNFNLLFKLWGASETNLHSSLNVNSPSFFYYLDRGRSGVNRLNFDLKTSILSSADFSNIKVNVEKSRLSLQNGKMEEALVFDANSRLEMNGDNITANFRLNEMSLHFKNLFSTLTEALQEPLEPLASNTSGALTFHGDTDFSMVGDDMKVNHLTNIRFDEFDIDDIYFKAKVDHNPKLTNIHYITLEGLDEALEMSIYGDLREKFKMVDDPENPERQVKTAVMSPNIDFSFYLGRHERGRIFQNQTIEGAIAIAADINDSIVVGSVSIDKFYYDDGGFTRVNNVNLLFPFRHDMELQKTVDLGSIGKKQMVSGFTKDYNLNFSVDSVEIPNPNNNAEPLMIIYPGGEYSGITSSMVYEENIFKMPIFQIFALNGLITIQDLAFNVGRVELAEMNFYMLMQVKNIDLKLIIPEERAETIEDGTVSFDIMTNISRMDDPINNLNGYFSIYHVGEKFGKHLLTIGQPDWEGRLLDTANNAVMLRKMDVNVKEGMVDIVTIISQKGAGALLDINDDIMETRRMQLQEFMQEATEQVKVYQVTATDENEENIE